jgi:IS5 family transposase
MIQAQRAGQVQVQNTLNQMRRLLEQRPKDKGKLYSLAAPEVECISKGKTRQAYEFGVKVTVATTHRERLVVGMRALPGNPYDGHALYEVIEQVEILTEHKPKQVFVDRGYRRASLEGIKVWMSGRNMA